MPFSPIVKSAPNISPKTYRAGNPQGFQHECIGLFAEVMYALGLPKSVGQMYGLLFASPFPLSFTDIVERLEISKGSASQGLQLLRSLGAINVTDARPYALSLNPDAGGAAMPRRDYFEPELRLRRLLRGIIRGRIEPLLEQERMRMRRLRELAEAVVDDVHREFRLERVKQLETWRRQATLVMPVFKTFIRFRPR